MTLLRASLLLALALSACRKSDEEPVDLDGDGHASDVDCDDTDASVHPDAPERCDGVDNDCDAEVDEDPTDALTFYADGDGDGYGDLAAPLAACAAPEGYVDSAGDCDDSSGDFHPGAPETDCADPSDYNCDGSVGYADADGDGVPACEECDDGDAARFPGNEEVCDGLDNDCDVLVDEQATDASTFYADADGDGHGNPALSEAACEAPVGFVATGDDCDDLAADSFPGAPELCDGRLNDCDGALPAVEADGDGDGFMGCEGDCDDAHASAFPGGTEICDHLDNDCDGQVDQGAVDARTWHADADGDGHGDPATGEATCSPPQGALLDGTDCDDSSAARFPGNDEVCDGLDNDCDGVIDDSAADAPTWLTDADGDGYGVSGSATRACEQPAGTAALGGDCDDDEPLVHPGLSEVCDSLDNDCDGQVDEDATDASTWYRDLDRDGYAGDLVTERACEAPAVTGWYASADDCEDLDRDSHPGADELCDGVDNDCDLEVDEDAVDLGTWYRDADADMYGDPGDALQQCQQPPGYVAVSGDCDDTDAAIRPGTPEACNGLDDDCDGTRDEGLPLTTAFRDGDSDGHGAADTPLEVCDAPAGYVFVDDDCDDTDGDVFPGNAETCDDGIDNTCDGLTDCEDLTGCKEPMDYCWVCSDGILDPDEECDDSNLVDLDGCDSTCAVEFDTATFTTCGATGLNGPSQANCDGAYLETELKDTVVVSGGMQTWTVPVSGTWEIEAWGAAGGSDTAWSHTGGAGLKVTSTLDLTQGQELTILVGQMGTNNAGSPSGGGGTFVVSAGLPLLVAGGGGGAGYYVDNDLVRASTTTSGNRGYTPNRGGDGAGGTSGNGGSAGRLTSGGGGFYGSGAQSSSDGGNSISGAGYGFAQGGAGGYSSNSHTCTGSWTSTPGGFGGGAGAGYAAAGPGGGYSGGGGADGCNPGSGGGGGSYCADQPSGACSLSSNAPNGLSWEYNSGPGQVVVTYLGG